MQGNPHDHHEEHLDVDAVCEACSNVNPEGTLLCKVCGNNLRDQRVRRMQAGGAPMMAEPKVNIVNIARGVLILLGIGTVLWTAFNVSTIENWLLSGVQSVEAKSETVEPESFWTGPDATHYADLSATLENTAMTIDEAAAVPPGAPMPSLDGRYILKRSAEAAVSPIGSAIVHVDGNTCYFVARLAGGTEIRGAVQKTSDTMFQAYNIGILDPGGTYAVAYGYAQLQPTGEIHCSGLFGEYEQPANIIAIPIPTSEASEPAPVSEPAPAAENGAAPSEPAPEPSSEIPAEPAPAAP